MARPRLPSVPERRVAERRGLLRPVMDALYRLLRWIGGHVSGFYAAVGLFLTIGLGLSLGAIALFAALARWVSGGTVQRLDDAVLSWVSQHRTPWLDALALAGAALGSKGAMWIVLILGSLFFWRSRHLYSMALLWISLLGGYVLNYVLKDAFSRPRPRLVTGDLELLGWRLRFPGSPSFPSGHALMSVVIYGTLAYLIVRLEPTRRMRRLTLLAAGVLVVGTGASRLYLTVHYPSDVLAGYLSGFVWATFCALSIEALRYFSDRQPGIRAAEADLERGIEPIREALRREPAGSSQQGS